MFFQSLPWLFNRNLLLKNVNVAISFYRNIVRQNVQCEQGLSQHKFYLNNIIILGRQSGLVVSELDSQSIGCGFEIQNTRWKIWSEPCQDQFLHSILVHLKTRTISYLQNNLAQKHFKTAILRKVIVCFPCLPEFTVI